MVLYRAPIKYGCYLRACTVSISRRKTPRTPSSGISTYDLFAADISRSSICLQLWFDVARRRRRFHQSSKSHSPLCRQWNLSLFDSWVCMASDCCYSSASLWYASLGHGFVIDHQVRRRYLSMTIRLRISSASLRAMPNPKVGGHMPILTKPMLMYSSSRILDGNFRDFAQYSKGPTGICSPGIRPEPQLPRQSRRDDTRTYAWGEQEDYTVPPAVQRCRAELANEST